MKKLVKILEFLGRNVFMLLQYLPVERENIIFSCRAAKDYADNSKALYEYFLEIEHENVYFYTKKKSILSEIPRNGIYAYSFNGFYQLLKAKMLVFTHGLGDFYPFFPKNNGKIKFINLHHGTPIKRIGSTQNRYKFVSSFIVSSCFEKNYLKNLLHLEEKQMCVLGQPRNDRLIEQKKNSKAVFTKKILYAPTFRDSYHTELFPFPDTDLISLDNFLKNHNLEIAVRMHINDENLYFQSGYFDDVDNIYFEGSDLYPSINEVLTNYHMLISDYSSIIIDYLLLDRPIGYILYDFDQFQNERGFAFEYLDHLSGPVIKTQKDLYDFISLKPNDYDGRREVLKNKFHKYTDGKSSQRLYDHVLNMLNPKE